MRLGVLLAAVALLPGVWSEAPTVVNDDKDNVTVTTSNGPVVGKAGNSTAGACATFYGVRYAAPPTGTNRFRPPQPPAKWSEPQPAVHVGKSCMQNFADSFINLPEAVEYLLQLLHLGMEPMAEDCLFLNVFSPRIPPSTTMTTTKNDQDAATIANADADAITDNADLLPVMVWFHGGSNLGGSGDLQSNIPFYDGRRLCETGEPAVIVTVNYRLGIFGFYADDELLQTEGTAGNMGIQDQRAALEWVAQVRTFGRSVDDDYDESSVWEPRQQQGGLPACSQ